MSCGVGAEIATVARRLLGSDAGARPGGDTWLNIGGSRVPFDVFMDSVQMASWGFLSVGGAVTALKALKGPETGHEIRRDILLDLHWDVLRETNEPYLQAR